LGKRFIYVRLNTTDFWCFMLLLQMAEYRVSIYGRKQSEWDQMASWIVNNELYSENVVWLIQVLTRI
jgi:adenosine deaminase